MSNHEPGAKVIQPSQEYQLFQHIFEYAADGYIVMNSRFEILYMNQIAKKWFGDTPLHHPVHCKDLLHCHDEKGKSLGEKGCFGQCVLFTKASLSDVEMNVKNEGNEPFTVSVTYSYIPTDDEVEGRMILMSLRDITDKKKIEREQRKVDELQSVLRERERLARDLHDTLAQDMAYANMQVKVITNRAEKLDNPEIANSLKDVSGILDQCFVELRQTLKDLNFSGGDLPTFLHEVLTILEVRTGIQTNLQIEGALDNIRDHVLTQVARLIKETLNNVRKHALATRVEVQVKQTGSRLIIRVADNGQGFDPSKVDTKQHFGLRSIRERCKSINGVATLKTVIGEGTQWEFQIDLQS